MERDPESGAQVRIDAHTPSMAQARMRFAGRLSGWNDDKGYGFVQPHEGGERAFVHIKSFPARTRRPADGDLISYSTTRDARGRVNATAVRLADDKPALPGRSRLLPRSMLGAAFLLGVVAAAAAGILPVVFTGGYLLLSATSYFMYWSDKAAAGKGRQRTAEATLHLSDLLGGWPGALIAQQQFRHKTIKASYQSMFWLTVIVNVATVAWLVQSGTARALARVVAGD